MSLRTYWEIQRWVTGHRGVLVDEMNWTWAQFAYQANAEEFHRLLDPTFWETCGVSAETTKDLSGVRFRSV